MITAMGQGDCFVGVPDGDLLAMALWAGDYVIAIPLEKREKQSQG